MNHLSKARVNAHLRRSRGKDIDAACGQLANKNSIGVNEEVVAN
jgi:23S rRNA (adenine2503-C2)-methyltransferase